MAAGLAWATPAVTAAIAAPLAAASPGRNIAYQFRGSVFSERARNTTVCGRDGYGNPGFTTASVTLSNQVATGTSPLGFTIVELPLTNGSGISPRTTATLAAPVHFVAAYPAGMIQVSSTGVAGFAFAGNTGVNWSAPTVRRNVSLKYGFYDVFTFAWRGNRTQQTVTNVTATGAGRPLSWAGTALQGTFQVTTRCYLDNSNVFFNYYAGGTASA